MKRYLSVLLAIVMVFSFAACGKKEPQKETVTVSFDTDGGSTVESQTIAKGSAVVKPETPKKPGFIFETWKLGNAEYEFGTAVNSDITLKASWIDPNSANQGDDGQGGSDQSGSDQVGTDTKVEVESLSWVNNWYWVQIKCEGDPEINIVPESARQYIEFSSSDTSIATVNKDGIVYGVKEGKCTIIAKCGDKTCELPLEVRAANGIYFSDDIIKLDYNSGERSYDSASLLRFKNDSQDKTISWSSSDPRRLPVDSNGVVTVRKVGLAIITATDIYGNTASYEIFAYGSSISVYVDGVDISIEGYTFEKGKTYEVSVCEVTYLKEGLSKSVYISDIVDKSGSGYFVWSPSSEMYYGYLEVKASTPSQLHALSFTNPKDGVTTGNFVVTVK